MLESYSIIEKKYDFSNAGRFATVITYDLPVHLSIRFDFENNVAIDRIGHDADLDLAKTQIFLTIDSNDGRVLQRIHEMGPNYYKPRSEGFPSRWDIVTFQVHVPTNREPDSGIVIDFKNSNTFHDRILLIDAVKFYVNSGLLSVWSEFFATLFDGNFLEKESWEIPVKDVEPDDFETLLNVIYPTRKAINEDNVVSLWKLADRFLMTSVIQMCENFLTTMSGKYMVPLADKTELALSVKSDKLLADCTALLAKMDMGK